MTSNNSPTYFLTAASGNIGKRLVPLLLSHPSKPTLVLPTRDPDRLRSNIEIEADETRVKVIQGNIEDPIFVESTLKESGVTAAFICLTGGNELMLTLNIFDALKRAGTVKHLVYLTACGNIDIEDMRSGNVRNNGAGHVAVKPIVEAKLRYGLRKKREEVGGFSWTMIGPTLFFDNDLRSKESILKNGFFDEPTGGKGVSRVDPADIALAVAKALEDDGKVWGGKKIMIGSLKTYTNVEIAKLWSDALGREVSPALSDEEGLEAFEEYYRSKRGPMWARDMRLMFEFFEEYGFGMDEAQYRDQVALLGKEPESYEEFIKRASKSWLQE